MDALGYLKQANRISNEDVTSFPTRVSINLITNFTDTILQKLVQGICISQNIFPDIYAVPYQQYLIEFKDPESGLAQHPSDITFVCFDVNPFVTSPFHSMEHFDEVLGDLEQWALNQKGSIILTTFPLPYRNAYGNLFESDPLYQQIRAMNVLLIERAARIPNAHLCDINRLLHTFGEERARDLRHLYSADIPFTNEFSVRLCEEWCMYLRLQTGKIKKCIVVDLDHTLWGGVLGEEGPQGITLGPGYPGNAFQEFQRALLSYQKRGILLAINSRNNPEDVQAAFEQNPHMVLKLSDFAATAINWNDKAENLVTIASELNIGIDSLVFFDDDAMNRAMVTHALPDVLVPEFSVPPEAYTSVLYGIRELNQLRLTEEDLVRTQMVVEERDRKQVLSVSRSVEEYIAALELQLTIRRNPTDKLERLAQLTQKTNQFNLTTERFEEADIERSMFESGFVFSGDVVDKYGTYGTTLLAICEKISESVATLRIFLMSCRVMGRGVEAVFLDSIIQTLKQEGITELRAEYIPTAKNAPCKEFLPTMGLQKVEVHHYSLNISEYQTNPKTVRSSIRVIFD